MRSALGEAHWAKAHWLMVEGHAPSAMNNAAASAGFQKKRAIVACGRAVPLSPASDGVPHQPDPAFAVAVPNWVLGPP
jgi:hypothetical protein